MTLAAGRWGGVVMALVGSVALSGCSTIKVTTGHDPQADFGAYRTFSIVAAEKAVAPLVRNLVEREVIRALEASGLRRVAEDPDLEVYLVGGLEDIERLDPVTTTQQGYSWGGGTVGYESLSSWGVALEQQVPIGMLVVDLVDRDQNRGVWRGAVRAPLTRDPDQDIQRIQTAIGKLFADYPPRAR